jgi:hypothetical protein
MANRKISDLTALTAPASGDLLPIVDISEAAAADKNKKITYGELLASAPLGSAAAPSIAFEGDINTGIYSPGADQLAISTGGTSRIVVDASGNVNIDSSTLYVDAVNNRVGIDTSSPGRKLSVQGIIGAYNTSGANDSHVLLTNDGSVSSIQSTYGSTGAFTPLSFFTSATERARIDSSGRLLVGTSSARSFFSNNDTPAFQVEGTTTTGREASITSSDSGTSGAVLLLAKQRSGTIGGNTIVQSGDQIGYLGFQANDGSKMIPAAVIEGLVDGTPGANDMPGRLVFSTTADGAASPTERMRITSAGNVGIGTSSPGYPLTVNGRISYSGAIGEGADATLSSVSTTIVLADSATWQNVTIKTAGTERARIDSSGRLLVGASTSRQVYFLQHNLQIEGATNAQSGISITNNANNDSLPVLRFGKIRSTSIVNNGDGLGQIAFAGYDGVNLDAGGASINAIVDGTPGANDMPCRLVFTTTADGAASPTERYRITNDGVLCHDQPAPISKSAAATLTIAELKTGIIQYTGIAATLTLPTGTLTEGGFSGIYTNMTFEWSVINTGSGICTIGAGTAHTIVGSGTVAIGASARFTSRRTAANTFVSYRLS